MKILIGLIAVLLLAGCSLLPSMGAGAKLADEIAKNQIAFQEAIIKGAVSIDCATGWTVGAGTWAGDIKPNPSNLISVGQFLQSVLSVAILPPLP